MYHFIWKWGEILLDFGVYNRHEMGLMHRDEVILSHLAILKQISLFSKAD